MWRALVAFVVAVNIPLASAGVFGATENGVTNLVDQEKKDAKKEAEIGKLHRKFQDKLLLEMKQNRDKIAAIQTEVQGGNYRQAELLSDLQVENTKFNASYMALRGVRTAATTIEMEIEGGDFSHAKELAQLAKTLKLGVSSNNRAPLLTPINRTIWASACAKLGQWDINSCGGWSIATLEDTGDVPKAYSDSIKRNSRAYQRQHKAEFVAPRIPMEDKLTLRGDGSGGVFCYGIVMSPPEPTFGEASDVASHCDGSMWFSNFSDPARNIKKVIFGPMSVPR